MKKTFEIFMNTFTKYNAYVLQDSKNNSLVYISTDEFMIINNFFGLIAYGERAFNFDEKNVIIKYKIVRNELTKNQIDNLLKRYEKRLNHHKKITILEVE